ncbi:MAG: DUF4391 domain-containing protein [Acholeplasmataceae bacterium]|nr:DUF4391 domain-containing protein [Acholeplasmataceae bacterium]
MIELPASTVFNRRIPKQKFYDNLSVTPQLKRVFIEQISQIIWQNKIAPVTVNIMEGITVNEIEVLCIKLNQQGIDTKVLSLIDKEIPYHILFLLEYDRKMQAWISYKEASQAKAETFKPETYYHTEWVMPENLCLKLDGLNMDAVYENFVRQVAGQRLHTRENIGIKEAVILDEKRQKLQKEILALEKKMQREKQFNRQFELNSSLKQLKRELEDLK